MVLSSKKDVDRFLRKMYRFLDEDHKIHIKKLKGYSGLVYTHCSPTEVFIDPTNEIVATLIHEILHFTYNDLVEEDIIKLEKFVIRHLSSRQMRNLLKKLGDVL